MSWRGAGPSLPPNWALTPSVTAHSVRPKPVARGAARFNVAPGTKRGGPPACIVGAVAGVKQLRHGAVPVQRNRGGQAPRVLLLVEAHPSNIDPKAVVGKAQSPLC